MLAVLNEADAAALTYPSLAGFDKGDQDIINEGLRGRGVLAGGEIAATAPVSADLDVASVVVRYGDLVMPCAGRRLTFTPDPALPRWAIVHAGINTISGLNTIEVLYGTAAAAISPSTRGPGFIDLLYVWLQAYKSVALWAVYLRAAEAGIVTAAGATRQVLDKRVIVPRPAAVAQERYASAAANVADAVRMT